MIELGDGYFLLPDAGRFLAFALAGLALNLIPGADMALVIAASARGGARSGLAAAAGISCGAVVHLAAAIAGLSALIAASPAAFSLLRWGGVLYLIFLAYKVLSPQAPTIPVGNPGGIQRPLGTNFKDGVVSNVLNPTVGIFFMVMLPQFVDPAAKGVTIQMLGLGLWFIAVGMAVKAVIASAVARLANRLAGMSWVARSARWLGAMVLGGAAAKLAVNGR